MRHVFTGAFYPFRAITYLVQRPQFWRYVAIPIVLNVLLAALFYAGVLAAGFAAIDTLIVGFSQIQWVENLLRIVLGIVLFALTGFLFVRFGVILGSPWYARLSEQIEREQLGVAPPAESLTLAGIARDLWRALIFELKKLVLFLVLGGLLLLCNLIPVAGQVIATIGGVLLGALIACLDFFDGPLERRRRSFRAKLHFARVSLPGSLTFGLVCFGLVSIPLINLLAIPLCVIGGTLFFCEHGEGETKEPRTKYREL